MVGGGCGGEALYVRRKDEVSRGVIYKATDSIFPESIDLKRNATIGRGQIEIDTFDMSLLDYVITHTNSVLSLRFIFRLIRRF